MPYPPHVIATACEIRKSPIPLMKSRQILLCGPRGHLMASRIEWKLTVAKSYNKQHLVLRCMEDINRKKELFLESLT